MWALTVNTFNNMEAMYYEKTYLYCLRTPNNNRKNGEICTNSHISIHLFRGVYIDI